MNDLEKLVPVAEANSQNGHTPPNNKIIQLRTSKTIRDMPPIDWLIDGVLPEKKVSIIYGPYGAYKSFLCLDWAAHVVLGKSWHGHEVKQGPVVYICGEGAGGQGVRLKAWEYHNQMQIPDNDLIWYDQPMDVQKDETLKELTDAIHRFMVVPPKLVIFDTLSRCTNGMDENISKEVSQLFNLMTTFTKNEDLAVLFVHHTGKDESRKGRGSNVLSANADASIQIKGTTNGCEVVADRIKDADNFAPINLETEVVVFGQEKGENSLVLIKSDGPAIMPLSNSQVALMNALGDEVLSFTTWGKRVVDKKLMAGSTADREIRKLAKMKMVVKQGNMYSKTALFPTADTQKTLPDAQTDLDFEMITSQIMPDNTKEKKQVSQKVSLANDTSDTNEKSRSEQLQTQKGKKK